MDISMDRIYLIDISVDISMDVSMDVSMDISMYISCQRSEQLASCGSGGFDCLKSVSTDAPASAG